MLYVAFDLIPLFVTDQRTPGNSAQKHFTVTTLGLADITIDQDQMLK